MILRRNIFCYAMVAPALIISLVLGLYPVLDTIRISFLEYDLLTRPTRGTPFVGFQNYVTLFSDHRFITAMTNTVVFVLIAVTTVVSLGLLIAQVLNQRFRGRGIVRMIALFPWFIPPVVASMIWLWIFNTDRSPINHVLYELGLIDTNVAFLTNLNTVGPFSLPMLAVALVRVWGGLPFVIIFILAGLQSLPEDIFEAAKIDGAGVFQRFFLITLPMLRPVLSILITLLLITGLGHFEINYVMTRGGPRDLTNILAVLSYQQAFDFYRFDLAAATSVVILILTLPVAILYIRNQIKSMES
jgi:ABC-type sugar transport system permease subunit